MKSTVNPPRFVRFGVYEVDLLTSELRKQGRKVKLQEQQCRILAILLEQPGEVVTREELRKRLWAEDTFVDFDHSLNTAIMRLRESLGESPGNPRFIETLPRIGYRFIAPVREVSRQATSDGGRAEISIQGKGEAVSAPRAAEKIEQAIPRADNKNFKTGQAIFGLAILLLVTVAVIGIAWRSMETTDRPAPATTQLKSLVVLPLENLSGDVDQEYFADGMTDELIARLAQIRSLRVISRTSAMEYKRTHKPLSEIAKELNVDAIVEGTVLRSGNRVRITAELIQVSTDRHLWADTYESEMGDVLTLQSRVASAIVNEIRIKLTPEEQKLLAANKPISTESYENYLKGRYYWNKRSEEDLRKAIDYFELATKQDPTSALAYAGLADCYSIIGSAIVGTVPAKEVAPKGKAAATRALELDSSLAEAQTSLATVNFNYDWDWTSASDGFKRAIELNRNYATAYQRYSLYLMAMGRTQDSMAQIDHARELDPLSISVNFSYGWRLYMARQYDKAIEQLRNTLDMDPNFALPRMVLGQAYEEKGAYDQAISELQKAVAISHQSPPMMSALAHAYAESGHKAQAEKILAEMMEQAKTKYVSPFYIALVYVGMKENDTAMEWMEKAFADRSNGIIFLKVDPQLDPLRSNPRFQSLQAKMAFPL